MKINRFDSSEGNVFKYEKSKRLLDERSYEEWHRKKRLKC